MAEDNKKKKTVVSRNLETMSVIIGGVEYKLTTKTPATINALALAGFADNLIDVVASMTVKAGFSDEERAAKRKEKADEINKDILRSSRVAVIDIGKATEKISKVAETATTLSDKEKAELAKLLAKMTKK